LREQTDWPGEPVEAVRLYGIKEYRSFSSLYADARTNRGASCLIVSPTVIQARRRPDTNHTQIRLIHETIQSSNCWRRGCRPSQRVFGRAYLCREHAQPSGRLPPNDG